MIEGKGAYLYDPYLLVSLFPLCWHVQPTMCHYVLPIDAPTLCMLSISPPLAKALALLRSIAFLLLLVPKSLITTLGGME